MTASESKKVYIGIDPGLHGAIAIIDEKARAIGVHDMPLHKGGTGKDEVDVATLYHLLDCDPVLVVLEKVGPDPKWGKTSIWSFARSFESAISCLKLKPHRHELVSPQTWKHHILVGTKKDKPAALAWATRFFPDVDLDGKDGRAEALALAEYGRRFFCVAEDPMCKPFK